MFKDFSGDSKLWAFAADKFFDDSELLIIQNHLKEFLPKWAAHGTPLKNDFEIIGNNILLIAVDETVANASGCSIDALVRKIKEIGKAVQADFFNRLSITVEKNGNFIKVPFSELSLHKGASFYNLNITKLNDLKDSFKSLID